MDIKAEVDELKYKYEKALRIKESLQKNMDRRKKLNLLDLDSENSLKDEIQEATRQADDLKRQMRSLESQYNRSRVISETHETSPWDN